jgi:autotransporter passenger strand-loop-strand repeat protein
VASVTRLLSGALDYVLTGGTVSGAILSGGTEIAFGTATSATVAAGTQVVESGGSASATALDGGLQDIASGGTASGTVISGGYQYVFSGGAASGTVISAGALEVATGGSTGAGAVTFSGGGRLLLDDSVHFGGLVAGFAVPDQLDLADVAFEAGPLGTRVSWTQLTTGASASGSLMVGNGTPATTANITLLGTYITTNFQLGTDGRGGTLVTDPPVAPVTDPVPFALVAVHPA